MKLFLYREIKRLIRKRDIDIRILQCYRGYRRYGRLVKYYFTQANIICFRL